jgi:hypothetical protein
MHCAPYPFAYKKIEMLNVICKRPFFADHILVLQNIDDVVDIQWWGLFWTWKA